MSRFWRVLVVIPYIRTDPGLDMRDEAEYMKRIKKQVSIFETVEKVDRSLPDKNRTEEGKERKRKSYLHRPKALDPFSKMEQWVFDLLVKDPSSVHFHFDSGSGPWVGL
jgi:hypothetical protein